MHTYKKKIIAMTVEFFTHNERSVRVNDEIKGQKLHVQSNHLKIYIFFRNHRGKDLSISF